MFTRISNLLVITMILVSLGGFLEVNAADTEANKAVRLRFYEEIWNQGNLDVIDEIYADNYDWENEFPGGKEGFKQNIAMTHAAFPDFHITVEEMITEGDMIASRYTATGTHTGEFMGIPPTGVQGTRTGINMARIVDGKILETWNSSDELGMMQQLGVITPGRPSPENYTWGAPSEVTGEPGDPETNKAFVVDSIERVWNQQDLNAVDETFSPDFVAHTPVEVNSPWVGTEVTKEIVAAYLTAFPDMHVNNEVVFAAGDKVVVHWTTTATHGGELMGIPPTGKSVTFTGTTIYRMADGKIVENWWAWDALGLMQQLTAEPTPLPEVSFLTGIHKSTSSGVVTNSGVTEQVMKDGVPHIITSGVEYELNVESTWKNDEITTGVLKVRSYIDLVPVSETEAKGKAYSTTEHYENGVLIEIGSAEADMTANLVTGESWFEGYLYQHGLGEYAGYSRISVTKMYVWIDEDGVTRVEGSGRCILTKVEHDFTVASVSQATTEKEPPLTGLHYSEISGIMTNSGEMEQVMKDGIPHMITRGMEYEIQPGEIIWDTGEVETGTFMKTITDADVVPVSETKAVGKNYYTGTHYSENGELMWFMSGQGDLTVDLTTGESLMDTITLSVGHGKYAGYTRISIADYRTWVDEDGTEKTEGTSRCITMKVTQDMSKAYFKNLSPGLNMVSIPLNPIVPHTARSFAEQLSATMVVKLDEERQRFVGFTLDAPDNGFTIEGDEGYIVNVPEGGMVGFTGTPWENHPAVEAAPIYTPNDTAWAFVVSGRVEDSSVEDGCRITVRNTRTGAITTEVLQSGYFAVAFADLTRNSVVKVGDQLEVTIQTDEFVSDSFVYTVTPENIRQAYLPITLKNVEIPRQSKLLQNYPNPFNPETWIPYQLKDTAQVKINIYDISGRLVRELELGQKKAGRYTVKNRAAYWDGCNDFGEKVSSGVYFYYMHAGDYSATKRMLILK